MNIIYVSNNALVINYTCKDIGFHVNDILHDIMVIT